MTTVVAFKVPDGIVLGADSAMTVHRPVGENRYDSYHKLSVVCGLPIATAMWGRGALGQRTVPSLVQEFSTVRSALRATAWSMEEVATELWRFVQAKYDELPPHPSPTPLNMLVAGFSKGSYHGQIWRFEVPGDGPKLQANLEALTISWFGVTEGIQTLWWGHSPGLHEALVEEGVPHDVARRVIRRVRERSALGPERLDFGMPLQNAVDLVGFLIGVEVARERYSPSLARSAPPVDVLVVRPGGVHWVQRKELIAPPTVLGSFLP